MSNRPSHRIVFKTKDGQRFDVAVIWPPKKDIPGLLGSLAPQKTNEDGQYKKMKLSEALDRVAMGDGFLDVWSTERSDSKPAAMRPGLPLDAGDFGDDGDDLPF
jgi:hypothetical protein